MAIPHLQFPAEVVRVLRSPVGGQKEFETASIGDRCNADKIINCNNLPNRNI